MNIDLMLGILCLVLTGGVSWVLVGIVYSNAARKGLDSGLIQLFTSLSGFVINSI